MTIGYGSLCLCGFIGRFFPSPATSTVAVVLLVITFPATIWGCWRWAQGLGHQGAVGLLGLFFPLGTAILLLLPDQYPDRHTDDD